MSPGAFDAALSHGINTFALSPDDYAMQTYAGTEKRVNAVFYNCCPPFKDLQVFPITEIVYHACEWDRNYLDQAKTQALIEFLSKNQFSYEFMGDLNGKV